MSATQCIYILQLSLYIVVFIVGGGVRHVRTGIAITRSRASWETMQHIIQCYLYFIRFIRLLLLDYLLDCLQLLFTDLLLKQRVCLAAL